MATTIRYQKETTENHPKTTDKQKAKQKRIFNKISREEFKASNDSIDIVMDDETYINVNGHNFQGVKYYFESGFEEVDDHTRYRDKTKFPEKILIWAAVSRKGISKVMFRRQKEGAVNADVYSEECIRKRLVPFIREHYSNGKYLF